MAVCLVLKVAMQCEDIPHQVALKLLHVEFPPFSSQKLLPREKQVFNGNDILKRMSENFLRVDPPPQGFAARFGASQTGLFVVECLPS